MKRRSRSFALPAAAGSVAVALAARCFTFPFLWDDFDFLQRARLLQLGDLLPSPTVFFYRPISREIYFGLLSLLGSAPLIGHGLNMLGIVAVVCLLFSTVRRIAGAKAGFVSAVLFSSLGALPVLVGWVSGIQDILAMAFLLAAIRAELAGPSAIGPAFFAAALLSKETAVALLPAIVFAGTLRAGGAWPSPRRVMLYGTVGGLWAAVHPGVRLLLSHGLRGGSGGYLAAGPSSHLENVWRAVLAMLNLPLGSGSFEGLMSLAPFVATACALIWITVIALRRSGLDAPVATAAKEPRIALLAGLMILPPMLMTSLFLQHWSPYYVCLPALGLSLLAGVRLAKADLVAACLLASAYLLLGAWSRTVAMEPTVTTEENLRTTGGELRTVESGFKKLEPAFPASAAIYVSAQVPGATNVYHHLYRFQPLRVWYREPSLVVLDPNGHHQGQRPTFLFWIDARLDVFEIDLETLAPRTNGPAVGAFAYQKTLRTFTYGRAGAGEADRAVELLTMMPGRTVDVAAYDYRTAGAILYAAGRDSAADALLQGVPRFGRAAAMQSVFGLLGESTAGLDWDDAAMRAFGFSPRDPEANRQLMLEFEKSGWSEPAVRFARRTLGLAPNDADARRVLARWPTPGFQPQLTIPSPGR